MENKGMYPSPRHNQKGRRVMSLFSDGLYCDNEAYKQKIDRLQAAGDALAEDVERILAERERQLDGCSDDFKAIATQKLRTKLAAWNAAKEMT